MTDNTVTFDPLVDAVVRLQRGEAKVYTDGTVNAVVRVNVGPPVQLSNPDPVSIVVTQPTANEVFANILVNQTMTPLVIGGPIGERGPQGPPGSGTASQFAAAGPVGGLRLVVNGGNGVEHANPNIREHGFQIIGVSLQSAVSPGDLIEVQQSGSLSNPSFNFIPGQPVYTNEFGVLTQTPPTDPTRAWQTVVGHATDANTLFINIQDPVFLC